MADHSPGARKVARADRFFWPLATALLVLLAVVQILSVRQETQTWDEGFDVAAGYAYLKTGEFRIDIQHPPLSKLLAALPLLALNPVLPAAPLPAVEYGSQFLYHNRVPADTLLFAGRSVAILGTLALGLVMALWARRAFGAAVALLALALLVFDPNIIAHGRYVKNDVPVTLLAFLCVITWAAYVERPRRWMLVLAGALFGLAMATKFSAAFLLPAMALLGLKRRWRGVLDAVAATAIGLLVVMLVYAPEASKLAPATSSAWRAHPDWRPLAPALYQNTITGKALAWMGDHLGWRDHSFLVGLSHLALHNHVGHPAYLLGMHSNTGWWYYFPVAFAVKTPVATLAAILLAVALAARSSVRPRFATLALLVPILVYVPFCLASRINLGVRHLLPIYPFLFVLVSAVLLERPWKGRAVTVALLAVALGAESLAIYPHYLAFFNVLTGGPANGPRYLVDSNLDWGQDVKKLKAYVETHGISYVCLAYFGNADTNYYGLPCVELLRMPDPEKADCVVAVSATLLEDVYVAPGTCAWLRQRKPTARVGYSIYVYDLREPKRP